MVNFAVIGPGRMGTNYAKVIYGNTKAKLVAICGNTEETTTKNAQGFSGVSLYFENKWEEMFEAHPEIEVVIISTSDWAHLGPFEAAIKYKKHIILEKPIASTPDDVEKMQALVRSNPEIKVMVCHTCRFDSRYVLAKKMIERGDIGAIGYVYCRRNADVKVASRVVGKIPMSYWITAHDIDLLRWYLQSEVKEVFAVKSEVPVGGDFIIANLLFENGVRAVVEIVWYSKPIIGQQHSRMDIEGELGKLELNLSQSALVQFNEKGNVTVDEYDFVDMHGEYIGNTPNMINHFVKVFNGEVKPVLSFEDGLQAVRVCEAIHQSVENKKLISF